jgi:conjugative transfer signal peptidase TraF
MIGTDGWRIQTDRSAGRANEKSSQVQRRPGRESRLGQPDDIAETGLAPWPSAAAVQRPYLNTQQAAHFLGIGWRKLMRLRLEGAGPTHRMHGRLIVYRAEDLELWSRNRAAERARPRCRTKVCAAPDPGLRRLTWCALVAACIINALIVTIVAPPAPSMIWNVSRSAPTGLYVVRDLEPLLVGDMVAARVPPGVRSFAARRRYIPAKAPLIKRIAAGPGDRVCAARDVLRVNGLQMAQRQMVDKAGRWLPWWSGCATLGPDEYLLLMDHANSFDGRYFGLTSKSDIIGKAQLKWAR